MTFDQEGRQFRLLTVHCVLSSLAMSLAGGFIGAYLMRLGFSIAMTVVLYAFLLGFRLALRAALLPLVRRLGMRQAMLAGRALTALQFLPLIGADDPVWLGAWVLIVSAGECIYWPVCHAANAVRGGGGRRGWQIALRQIASTGVSVAGPVAGAAILTDAGPGMEFGIAAALGLASAAPLLWMGPIDLGRVPTLRQSVRMVDPVGLWAFAADGFMTGGLGIAWPMILFATLGSSYDALGWASSVAGAAGALAGLGCGIAIDRGYRHRLSHLVTIALLTGVALRVAAGWAPWTAFVANAAGAAVGGMYYPVIMSMMYDRAKRSESAYQFHLAAEAGWDTGAILGCLAAAATVWSGLPLTLGVLPSALGILVIHGCVRIEGRSGTAALRQMAA
jgi:hypothetical protein